MGSWGVKSYENDEAADALDAGYDRARGAAYEELMDDHNPLSFDEVQKKLASPETLEAALACLIESLPAGLPRESWDDDARLAFVGIVVRHAEFAVAIPNEILRQAIEWLEHEEIEWDEATLRRLRRDTERRLLEKLVAADKTP